MVAAFLASAPCAHGKQPTHQSRVGRWAPSAALLLHGWRQAALCTIGAQNLAAALPTYRDVIRVEHNHRLGASSGHRLQVTHAVRRALARDHLRMRKRKHAAEVIHSSCHSNVARTCATQQQRLGSPCTTAPHAARPPTRSLLLCGTEPRDRSSALSMESLLRLQVCKRPVSTLGGTGIATPLLALQRPLPVPPDSLCQDHQLPPQRRAAAMAILGELAQQAGGLPVPVEHKRVVRRHHCKGGGDELHRGTRCDTQPAATVSQLTRKQPASGRLPVLHHTPMHQQQPYA